MTKRISRGIMLVAFVAFAACFSFMFYAQYRSAIDACKAELRVEAAYIAHGAELRGMAYFEELNPPDAAVEYISPQGEILYQSAPASLQEPQLSYDRTLADGSVIRVRTSLPAMGERMLSILLPSLLLILPVLLFSVWLASAISQKIVAPLNEIDPESPAIEGSYPELSPMLHKIRRQNELIAKQMADLRRQQEEFRTITENMEEGFLLIDKKTEILSYNTSAWRLLGRDRPAGEQDASSLERSPAYRAAVGEALTGHHNEKTLEMNGRIYQLIANPVTENGKTDGAVIVLLDVTEKRRREQMRREFTSNVSHELKTPLTSIYGISDMLMNHMVREEDIPRFAGTIHSESGRLITLVEDTIKLSQLDEESIPYEREDVDLYATAAEVIARLYPEAQRRQITVSLEGESRTVNGVRSILTEILSNLCDNAVKYNRDGGQVQIFVGEADGRTAVSVSDTGIGIPKEHLDRVFERFYRVDKSHSRDIGGTGLGLSIVKHGAAYHGAEVQIDSREGEGTTVRILFP